MDTYSDKRILKSNHMFECLSNVKLVESNPQFDILPCMRKEYPKNYIKECRELAGLSLQQLAEMIGTTNQYLSMMENSRRGLGHHWIIKIANALERRASDITDGPPVEKEEEDQDDRQKMLAYYDTLSAGEKRMFSHTLKSFAEKEKQPYDDFSDRIKPKKAD